MASSGGVFSTTLQSITTTKLQELAKKQRLFEDQKASLLATAARESDQTTKLNILLDGVSEIFAITNSKRKKLDENGTYIPVVTGAGRDGALETTLQNLAFFLKQAAYDPSISPKLMNDWELSLIRQLDIQSEKYRYATLYGKLVMEWLSSDQAAPPSETSPEASADILEEESQEREESRKEWEKLVFQAHETDPSAITAYLKNLFGDGGKNKQAIKAFGVLRDTIGEFDPGQFDNDSLEWTINGLLASDLLSPDKRAALKDFLANPIILTEIADVLNLRLASIASWTWDTDGLLVETRRNANGKYHIYVEEDILQAIFLQFIGVKFSVLVKRAVKTFSDSDGAWKSLRKFRPIDRKRRDYFLGSQSLKPSVQSRRQAIYKSIYFMSQLQDSENKDKSSLDGEVEYDYSASVQAPQMAQQPHQQMAQLQQQLVAQRLAQQQMPPTMLGAPSPAIQRAPSGSNTQFKRSKHTIADFTPEYDLLPENEIPNSPMATKQALLHLVSTELLVNTRFHGAFTCARSEFESWNPSLPHSTAYAVLSFFGVSTKWQGFFRKYLECPLKFADDKPGMPARTRKRGVLGAHVLSTVVGEVILFALDYAVNQSTDGAQLFRMHDDFWVWSSSQETVVKAWGAVTQFSDVMGVTLNKAKSGTISTVRKEGGKNEPGPVDPSLPEGNIRWGFLFLDPSSGRFIIDQEMVNSHVDKLERQLQDRKSIFDWIQTWNAFAGRFFTSNFGKPANCFGREHVNSMLTALETIQRRVFSGTSVVEYLKTLIETRFGVTDIPDGYFYFPADLGGLELNNPFIGLVQLQDAVYEDPDDALSVVIVNERDAYRTAKIAFENRLPGYVHRDYVPEDRDKFMSYDEYAKFREEFASWHHGNISSVFEELLRQPAKQNIRPADNDTELFEENGMQDDYLLWVALLYKDDMMKRFGGLKIVDRALLPTSMISLYRSGRVKWQG